MRSVTEKEVDMNPKTVTARNLIGAFCGGALGILLAGYVHPFALPFGVFLGVVCGWWHDEIWSALRHAYTRAEANARMLRARRSELRQAFDVSVKFWSGVGTFLFWTGKIYGAVISHGIVQAAAYLANLPGRFYRWLCSDREKLVYTITVATMVLVCLGGIALGIYAEVAVNSTRGEQGTFGMAGLVSSLGGLLTYSFSIILENERDPQAFVKSQRYGLGVYVFSIIVGQVRCTVGAGVFLALALVWGFGVVMFWFMIMLMLGGVLAAIRWFAKLAARPGHLLCLGATTVTTLIAWAIYHTGFRDQRVLWTVALGTGIIAGGVTELTRRLALLFFSQTKLGQILVDTDEEPFDVFEEQGFVGRIFVPVLLVWFRQTWLARLVRFICFGETFQTLSVPQS